MGNLFEGNSDTSSQISNNEDQSIIQEFDIRIATFDYGIVQSPFEFASSFPKKNKQLETLQNLFKQQFQIIMKVPFSKEFRWEIGKLDNHLKKGRFSPLYNKNAGVFNQKFLMNFQQFEKKWEKIFTKMIQAVQYEKDKNFNTQKKNLLQMDWIFFRTFVRYSFLPTITYSFQHIILNQHAFLYRNFMDKKFQSKIIDEKYKIEKLVTNLIEESVDILFLQDINSYILDQISLKTDDYRISQYYNTSCAILISQEVSRKICGSQRFPLPIYNRVHIKPSKKVKHSMLQQLPPLKPSMVKKTTKYYQQKLQRIQDPVANQMQNPQKNNISQESQDDESLQSGKIVLIHENVPNRRLYPQFDEISSTIDENQTIVPISKLIAGMQDIIDVQTKHYLPEDLREELNWNKQTMVQFLGQFIFISSSLGNEQVKKGEKITKLDKQYERMIQCLTKLKNCFKNYVIIVGIDLNRSWQNIQNFNAYPSKNFKFKKSIMERTIFQSNLQRVDKKEFILDDYLISNLKIEEGEIEDINNKKIHESNSYLIPCQKHPYDHFFTKGVVKYKRKKLK